MTAKAVEFVSSGTHGAAAGDGGLDWIGRIRLGQGRLVLVP